VGKTSIMSKLADTLYRTQNYENRPVIIRFCGTSARSKSILPMIISICHQINFTTGREFDEAMNSFSYYKAVKMLHALLAENPIILIIDAVNDLNNQNLAKTDLTFLQGLIAHADTRIVLSTDSDADIAAFSAKTLDSDIISHGCENKLRSAAVPIVPLDGFDFSDETDRSNAKEMVVRILDMKERVLSVPQWERFMLQSSAEPTPLFLLLAALMMQTWASADESVSLPATLDGLICEFFSSVESEFGQVLFGYAMGAIAMCMNGITETELLDVLASSDVVVSHIGGLDNSQMVIANIWIRLKHRMQKIIVEVSSPSGCLRFVHPYMRLMVIRRIPSALKKQISSLLGCYFGNLLPRSVLEARSILAQPMILNEPVPLPLTSSVQNSAPVTARRPSLQSTPISTVGPGLARVPVSGPASTAGLQVERPISVWLNNSTINRRRCIEAPHALLAAEMVEEAIGEVCSIENCCARVISGNLSDLIFSLADLAHCTTNPKAHHYLRFILTFAELEECAYPAQHLLTTALLQPVSSVVREEAMELLKRYEPSSDFLPQLWIRSREFGLGHDFDNLLASFRGHTMSVLAVDISSDGRTIASCSEDGTVRYWDAYTGHCLHLMEGHKGAVYSISFNTASTRIISGGRDKIGRVWETQSGLLLLMLEGHTDCIQSVCYNVSGSQIATGSRDKTVRLWDSTSGESVGSLERHRGVVTCICYCGSDNRLLSGSEDDMIYLWDTTAKETLKTFEGHSRPVTSLSVNGKGTTFVSASRDKSIRIWDIEKSDSIAVLERHSNRVTSVSFNREGTRVLSACDDNHILLWDVATSEVVKSFLHQPVTAVKFSSCGNRFVSGSFVKTVNLWDVSARSLESALCSRLENITHSVSCICFTDDDKRVVTGNAENSVYIWDCASGSLSTTLGVEEDGHAGAVTSVCVRGNCVISGSADRTVIIWDLTTKEKLSVLRCDSAITTVSANRQGTRLLVGTENKELKLFGLPIPNEVLSSYRDHTDVVLCSCFSDDSAAIAIGTENFNVHTYVCESGVAAQMLVGHTNRVTCIAMTKNGTFLVSGSADKTIRVWNLRIREEVTVLTGHTVSITALSIGGNDATLVSASVDKSIRVWNLLTGQLINTLFGHTNKVICLALSNHGRFIASGSSDKTVRIWDSSTAVRLATES
jgi:WD40 repeat protein